MAVAMAAAAGGRPGRRGSGIFESGRRAALDQLHLLRICVGRPDLAAPMFAIWVASFGGGEHSPVTTYFLQKLGASTEQLGNFGVVRTVGCLLLSPFYGWLLDKRSAYLPVVLSSFCCSFGCLFRGLTPVDNMAALYGSHVVLALGAENFWNVVGAYVALAVPRDMRPVAVSGFQVQVQALNLLGTSLYAPTDSALVMGGISNEMTRYRIHMGGCSLFCVFGFIYMLFRFRPVELSENGDKAREDEKTGPVDISYFQISILLLCLVVQAFGNTVMTVLWPLHLRKLGWDSHEFAWLDVSSKVLAIIGTLAYPAVVRSLGHKVTAVVLPAVACVTLSAAFSNVDTTPYPRLVHVPSVMTFVAACSVMKVCLQHLVTLAVPTHVQGRVFSLLTVLNSVGVIAGNLLGTRLLDYETPYSSQGTTPFLLASALFLAAAAAAASVSLQPPKDTTGERDVAAAGKVMDAVPARAVGAPIE